MLNSRQSLPPRNFWLLWECYYWATKLSLCRSWVHPGSRRLAAVPPLAGSPPVAPCWVPWACSLACHLTVDHACALMGGLETWEESVFPAASPRPGPVDGEQCPSSVRCIPRRGLSVRPARWAEATHPFPRPKAAAQSCDARCFSWPAGGLCGALLHASGHSLGLGGALRPAGVTWWKGHWPKISPGCQAMS